MTWTRYPLLRRVLLVASAYACTGGSGGGTEPVPIDDDLSIRPGRASILTGDTLHLGATGPNGVPVTGAGLTWSSSAPEVAAVDAAGRVTAVGPGTAMITGTDGDASGEAWIFVARGSGERVAAMAAFDSIVPAIMRRWSIPGGAVAVVKDGRLVFARGYGLADVASGDVVQPDALFRIASLSKPITAAAALKLEEDGQLDLDAKAFGVLTDLEPPPDATVDPRLDQITIRQLLYHSGGWNRDITFDPMFRSTTAAEAVGATAPASAETVIRYMKGMPLQFDPGSAYSYSNFGYAVLGRNIERATGLTYEQYVQSEILAPMGISRMRIGRSLPFERPADEVHYYDAATTESVFPGVGVVPFPDGGFHLEAMDAHGGWIASTIDLLRFATSVDGLDTRPDLLSAATIDRMTARPLAPLWVGTSFYYAMGWQIRPAGGDANWWHTGSLPGTTALLVRAHNGLAWAALFNARAGSAQGSFDLDLDQAMWAGVQAVTAWPTHDLFAQHE